MLTVYHSSILLYTALGVCGLVTMACTAAEGYGVLVPLLLCVLPALAALVAALSKFPALYFGWRVQRDFERVCAGVGLSDIGSYLSSWKGIAKYGLLDLSGKGRANGVVIHPKLHNLAGNFEQWTADIVPLYGQSLDSYTAQAEVFTLAFNVPYVSFERGDGVLHLRAGEVMVPAAYEYPVLPAVSQLISPDLQAIPMALDRAGLTWYMPIEEQHILIAGRTGSGKNSWGWTLIFALEQAILSGICRIWAVDPKRVELSYGKHWFYRYSNEQHGMVELVEEFAREMQARASMMEGISRKFTLSPEMPLNILFIDELAYLTALLPDKKLRDRAIAALTTIITQGRAIGFSVCGILQDPRKDNIPMRDQFTIRIALGLPDKQITDMVLGDNAYDNGARCNELPLGPEGAGCGYVIQPGRREPILLRAAWCSDEAIKRRLGAPPDAMLETPALDYPTYE